MNATAEITEAMRFPFCWAKNAEGTTLIEATQQAKNGVNIAPEDDVEPDSDRCVTILVDTILVDRLA